MQESAHRHTILDVRFPFILHLDRCLDCFHKDGRTRSVQNGHFRRDIAYDRKIGLGSVKQYGVLFIDLFHILVHLIVRIEGYSCRLQCLAHRVIQNLFIDVKADLRSAKHQIGEHDRIIRHVIATDI